MRARHSSLYAVLALALGASTALAQTAPTTPGVTPMDTPTNATVGSSASDRALRDSVASAITSDPSLQGARINVTVNNGVVTLSGSAKDGTQASRARAVAEGVAGTARVNASISTSG